jgi:hypothetical protein
MYSHVNNDIHFEESVTIGKQNSDLSENNISESPINSKRSIDSRSSTDSRKSIDNKDTTNIELKNSPNIIFDFNSNPIDFELNDDIFSSSVRSRTNSRVSSNTSYNSTVTPKFTLKDITNPLTSINTKEDSKKIETTLSCEDLNDMFSSIDMTCDFLIKKNNDTTPPVTPTMAHNMEDTVVELYEEIHNLSLVNPVISIYHETTNELIEPLNDYERTVNEQIIKNDTDNFLLMVDKKENNDTENNDTDTINVTSEVTNDIDTNTQIAKKKRKKAKNKK